MATVSFVESMSTKDKRNFNIYISSGANVGKLKMPQETTNTPEMTTENKKEKRADLYQAILRAVIVTQAATNATDTFSNNMTEVMNGTENFYNITVESLVNTTKPLMNESNYNNATSDEVYQYQYYTDMERDRQIYNEKLANYYTYLYNKYVDLCCNYAAFVKKYYGYDYSSKTYLGYKSSSKPYSSVYKYESSTPSSSSYTRYESRPTYTRYESRPTYTRYESRPSYTRYESRPTYTRYVSKPQTHIHSHYHVKPVTHKCNYFRSYPKTRYGYVTRYYY